ncbi:hypothetical protein ACWGJ0_39865 [Streptomyces massasporeus]
MGTETSARAYAWATVTTLATLATILALALTGSEEAAVALAAAGLVSGAAIRVTIQIKR